MNFDRVYNFSAGPAVLPVEVLQEVQENILNFKGSGLGIMEMSHRTPAFENVIHQAENDVRDLLGIGDDYSVVFTTGGATQQFSMVPMNLLTKDTVADYLITGAWARNAYKEAKKFGAVNIASNSEEKNFSYIPKSGFSLSKNSAYVHFTSNNTIFGTQYKIEPEVDQRILVCDASSDLMHKKIEVSKYGLIYAGAQKNLGPAGVTLVIIRKELLKRSSDDLPILMDYRTYCDNDSMYNTPPAFSIYVMGEVMKHLKTKGGLSYVEATNKRKSDILYAEIDRSGFYRSPVAKEDRSVMNIVFRLVNTDLELVFIKEAEKAGFSGLKGHRSVGGIRASIYNSFPTEGVEALVVFMQEFERKA